MIFQGIFISNLILFFSIGFLFAYLSLVISIFLLPNSIPRSLDRFLNSFPLTNMVWMTSAEHKTQSYIIQLTYLWQDQPNNHLSPPWTKTPLWLQSTSFHSHFLTGFQMFPRVLESAHTLLRPDWVNLKKNPFIDILHPSTPASADSCLFFFFLREKSPLDVMENLIFNRFTSQHASFFDDYTILSLRILTILECSQMSQVL